MAKMKLNIFSLMFIILLFLVIVIATMLCGNCWTGAYITALIAGVLLVTTLLLVMFAVWLGDALTLKPLDKIFYFIPVIVVICITISVC